MTNSADMQVADNQDRRLAGILTPLNSSSRVSLTEQIVRGMTRLIDDRALLQGARLPSIRRFAQAHGVSSFTAIHAYDQLVASGHVESRDRSGFYVGSPARAWGLDGIHGHTEPIADVLWLLRRQANQRRFKHRPGSGWLPHAWLEESGLERALRELSRKRSDSADSGYGDPLGYAPLRTHVSRLVSEFGIEARPDQVLLESGATGAIDLLARYLVRPGDVVLVDDPGFYQWFGHLRALGATVHGVPWNERGPDLEKLEFLVRTHGPKLLVTNSIVQNPTGRSISRGTAFRLLQLAARYDFLIVEDAVSAFCNPSSPPCLASLDQLERVIYVNSFSKSLSPRLRVGVLVGHRDLVRDLADLKLLTHSASSEVAERLVCEIIDQGRFRKVLRRLGDRIEKTRNKAIHRLETLGLEPTEDETHGMFAWLDVPAISDATCLAEEAIERNMLLAPGALFRPNMEASSRLRFNVAFCQDDSTFRVLGELLDAHSEIPIGRG